MSEILSQNQIDALLSQGGFDGGGEADALGMGADNAEDTVQKDYAALTNAFELFGENATTVLSMVLNKTIRIEITDSKQTDVAAAKATLPADLLLLEIPFDSGLDTSIYALIGKKETAMLSDLMMMGDGTASYTDDHKDAIGELFNQIMSAYATALTDKCSESFRVEPVKVGEFTGGASPFTSDNSDMVLITMAVEGHDTVKLAIMIPNSSSNKLMLKCKAASSGGASSSSGELDGGIGLNMQELNDLSSVTSDFGSGGTGAGADFGGRQSMGGGRSMVDAPKENIDILLDIELDLMIELGKTNLSIKRILEMSPGAVVELDRLAGEPVDLLVNDKVVAKGEVVVVDENFGIRIVSLVSPADRIKSLQ